LLQAEDGIRDRNVTGVQTCALPIYGSLPRKYRAVPNSLGNVEQLHAAFVTPFDAGPRPRGLVHPVRPRGRQMEDVSGGPMGAIMSLRFLLGLRIGQHIRPT